MKPVLCPTCHQPGESEIRPPTAFDSVVWERRTFCRPCGTVFVELRGPYPLAITSPDQPIDWRLGNPFEGDDE